MPTLPQFPDLPIEVQQEIASLSLDEQKRLAKMPMVQVQQVMASKAFAAAEASTVRLTPEELAMDDEEFFDHIKAISEKATAGEVV